MCEEWNNGTMEHIIFVSPPILWWSLYIQFLFLLFDFLLQASFNIHTTFLRLIFLFLLWDQFFFNNCHVSVFIFTANNVLSWPWSQPRLSLGLRPGGLSEDPQVEFPPGPGTVSARNDRVGTSRETEGLRHLPGVDKVVTATRVGIVAKEFLVQFPITFLNRKVSSLGSFKSQSNNENTSKVADVATLCYL